MSANDVIYIDKTTKQVFYQGCADNNGKGKLIGQGTDLETAIEIAENYLGDGYIPEYGINFISSKKKRVR